ncbi:hypothetical protein QJS10_CPA10g01264 [Acorus calamus]|uniref:Pentatricopeptide repeat-containing protein n=1 Tax=Acorus calamus TaxID=4465 RepID=A0AAV9E0M4_ACOCL|nr:hypothetical protein QJS10_CPA10g01264 [Acorus calamus]
MRSANSWLRHCPSDPPPYPPDHHHHPSLAKAAAAAAFPSHLDSANLQPRALFICDILSRTTAADVESTLARSGIIPTPDLIEEVLKLSYSHPASAVKFFRWSGLRCKPTPYAWNLMVDVLGKNSLYEPMWDAVRSMKSEGVLSVSTFASIFRSYCSAGRFKEASMSFDVMDRYGVSQDAVALNSLLSAICREEGQAVYAADLFDKAKEGNPTKAKSTFGEMVVRVGWDPRNMSAYDAFLTTLVRGGQPDDTFKFLHVMKGKGCLPGMKFFRNALDILIHQGDSKNALELWKIMVGSGLVPNTVMYNAMIALLCDSRNFDSAFQLLDDMPFYGAFPNSTTYNTIFECLVKNKKTREAAKFLTEMRKNEFPPSADNCVAAVRLFFNGYDPEAAMEAWRCCLEGEGVSRKIDECANELLIGLNDLGRLSDVRRYAEEMLDQGVRIHLSTMEKLKKTFYKAGKDEAYSRLVRRVRKDHRD